MKIVYVAAAALGLTLSGSAAFAAGPPFDPGNACKEGSGTTYFAGKGPHEVTADFPGAYTVVTGAEVPPGGSPITCPEGTTTFLTPPEKPD